MHFQFRKLASTEGPVEFHEALDVHHVTKGRKDITHVSPLQADLKVFSFGEGEADVKGRLSVDLDMTCSRCLKPLKKQVGIDFEERFKYSENTENVQDEEDDIRYVAEDDVNLVPFIEEALLLNLPFAAVCKDDCKGLCPTCGTDLNERDCGCDKEVIDPRLAALKDFFKQQ
ncbi:YceD family protein [Paenibacillus sp. SN-8-1]|uniref:YceD family protein n=1 Tax=Paenibacillus sp. SN-8-1 TaxID=3435409 RepID=UPI003D9A3EF6